MFEISLFDILTFAAASAAALTAWHASQGYESTTRRFEKTLERGIAKTGGRASNDGTPDTLPISKTFPTSRPSLVRRIPSKANVSRS